jgi:hypothetical protein
MPTTSSSPHSIDPKEQQGAEMLLAKLPSGMDMAKQVRKWLG